MIQSSKSLLASAALVALLSACGSGSGGADDAAAPKSPAAHTGQGDAASADAAVAAKAVTGANAVTEAGVSAELLASILLENTHASFGHHPQMGGRAYPAYFPAEPWSGTVPGGTQVQNPTIPSVYASLAFSKTGEESGLGTARHVTVQMGGGDNNTSQGRTLEGGFKRGQLRMGVNVNEADFKANSSGGSIFNADAASPGKTLISLAQRARIHDDGSSGGANGMLANSDKTYDIRVGDTVPYYTTLQRWADDAGNSASVLLLRGEKAGEVRLCHDINTQQLKRLVCTLWQVDASWRFGARDGLSGGGSYIVDDRSTYPGQSGHLVWQTPERAK